MIDYTTLFKTQPTAQQLAQAFDSIEADITYSDDRDTIIYFNPFRIFERPAECLNQNLYDCHPQQVHDEVSEMLDAFRDGSLATVSREAVSSQNRKVRVCYHAMHDANGAFIGCLEVVTYRD
jgi:DUF438 domain-containing protein